MTQTELNKDQKIDAYKHAVEIAKAYATGGCGCSLTPGQVFTDAYNHLKDIAKDVINTPK